ncbi:MAG: AAA family ATPase [Atopobiaceae bacterium]|nr:AAA family ATPase [Atopobiaceae bacterium]
MAREVSIGAQGFEQMRLQNAFLVDKTDFIAQWWNSLDHITLICRPRRFGKTLTLDMVRCFLSLEFSGRGEELFGDLAIWKNEHMQTLQGTTPVVMLSFADCKGSTLDESLASIRQVIRMTVESHSYLYDSTHITTNDHIFLDRVTDDMDIITATSSIKQLCLMLKKHWGIEPVVLLDEYDTPLQEAWLGGYWDGMSAFMRKLFNSTFKSNKDLRRALITGITRVASESIFSDLNNPAVITTTTPQYQNFFGFTKDEVADALREFGAQNELDNVCKWYDGFTFGNKNEMFNPWSITCYLQWSRLKPYWANSSSNSLVGELIRQGGNELKTDFDKLLAGDSVRRQVNEFVSYRTLRYDSNAVWSLLLATGYLRVAGHDDN